MTEEEQAFLDWWNETDHTAILKPDGPLMLDVWRAGIEWERKQQKSFHDTPEVMNQSSREPEQWAATS